jgi:hypothetical protein
MKGLDVVMMVLLRASGRDHWTFAELSGALGHSVSQCHAARERLRAVRLLSGNPDKPWHVPADNFVEYLVHGLKYDFPAHIGASTRGVATAHSSDFVADQFRSVVKEGAGLGFVWPSAQGNAVGQALEPVHASQVVLAGKPEFAEAYRLMVLADLLRVGQARERAWAAASIEEVARAPVAV